jgi:hypothetical protein
VWVEIKNIQKKNKGKKVLESVRAKKKKHKLKLLHRECEKNDKLKKNEIR